MVIFVQVTKTHTSKTLISIKYNCFKNIALIHNRRKDNDLALEFLQKVCFKYILLEYVFLNDLCDILDNFAAFLQAIDLDDTDVYTVNKLGQIALNLEQLDVAQIAFEKVREKIFWVDTYDWCGFFWVRLLGCCVLE